MKKYKKVLIAIMAVILISNIPLISATFDMTFTPYHYKYSNFDGSSTSHEYMSRDFEMMKAMHKSCISFHPNQKDKNLYRLFWRNPLAFWRWAKYFYDERYELPYKNWKEIEAKRTITKPTQGCPVEF